MGGSTGSGGSPPSGAGGSGGSVPPQVDAAPPNDMAPPSPDVAADAGRPDASPADGGNAAIDPAVVAIMRRVADWQIPRMGTAKSWVHCVGWSGIMATHFLTKDPKYLQATVTWGGNWQLLAPNEPRGDVQCAAQAFYDSYLADPKPENMVRVNTSKPHLDNVVNGNLRGRVEWWWQDALFMVAPGFARLGTITGDKKYFDVLNRMWWDTYEYLWSPQNNLMYRDNNLRNRFWSRGNGWVVGAIARVLQHLPADDPKRPDFIKMLNTYAAKLITIQAPNGFWRSDLLGPATQGPESSGTSLFTFGLAYGINNGHLDRATYLPAVKKGWEAVVSAVAADGRLGYVQNIGASPGPAGPTETYPFGVGAFLLAGSEVAKIGGLDR